MTLIEKFVLTLILTILFGIGLNVYQTVTVDHPKEYQVWVKTTGNPQHLSYDEWLTKERMDEEKRHQTVTVYAPFNH